LGNDGRVLDMETLNELLVTFPGLVIRVNQKKRTYKIFNFKDYMAWERNTQPNDNNILYFCRIHGYDFKAHGGTFRTMKKTYAVEMVNLTEER